MENPKIKKYLFIFLLFFGVSFALSFDTLEIDEFCGNSTNGDVITKSGGVWRCAAGGSSGTGIQNYFGFWSTNTTLSTSYLRFDPINGHLTWDSGNFTGVNITGQSHMHEILPHQTDSSNLGSNTHLWGAVFTRFFSNGTAIQEVGNICTTDNLKCALAGTSTNNITGSFIANNIPRGHNQTALVAGSIYDNSNNVTITRNLSILGNYNITLLNGSLIHFPKFDTIFGTSPLNEQFFGYEAYNGSVFNSTNFLGGFYTPSVTGKVWSLGYGAQGVPVRVCETSDNCFLEIQRDSVATVGRQTGIAFTTNSNKKRWTFHMSTQQNSNDLILERNDTGTPGAATGGDLIFLINTTRTFRVAGGDNKNVAIEFNATMQVGASNFTGNINITSGSLTVNSLNAKQGQVVCVLANKTLGTCTSVVGVTGACTCV